ncbi:MAG: 50S ribosomal protein L21 [Planctomycetota bacterium]
MYAVIEDSGTQIKVSEGDIIKIDTRELAEDADTLTFDKVMLVGGEGEAKIGAPYVTGATVEADILEEGRDDKIDIWKKKRRKGYVRHKGHRQGFVRVKVTGIKG